MEETALPRLLPDSRWWCHFPQCQSNRRFVYLMACLASELCDKQLFCFIVVWGKSAWGRKWENEENNEADYFIFLWWGSEEFVNRIACCFRLSLGHFIFLKENRIFLLDLGTLVSEYYSDLIYNMFVVFHKGRLDLERMIGSQSPYDIKKLKKISFNYIVNIDKY